jgi:hypothetical protein
MNNIGIHIFEQNNPLEWEIEIVSINLLSALSWKRFHGPIHLYCNEIYYDTLKKWGVDKVYDYINTDVLDNKPKDIDYIIYWAYSKMIVLRHLKDNPTPYTIIDNDLWILSPLDLNKNCDVIMYHKENFDINFYKNVYVDFNYIITDEIKQLNLNSTTLPTNCALLHIKNNNFLVEWLDLCETMVKSNFDFNKFGTESSNMCFIEQRLLPMLLEKRGFTYDTFIDHIYQSHLIEAQDGSEWLPDLDTSSKESLTKFESIKHVWGLKKLLHYNEIKSLILSTLINSLREYDIEDKPYFNLVVRLVENYRSCQSQNLAS